MKQDIVFRLCRLNTPCLQAHIYIEGYRIDIDMMGVMSLYNERVKSSPDQERKPVRV